MPTPQPADDRDVAGTIRDEAAAERDRTAEVRDRAAEAAEQSSSTSAMAGEHARSARARQAAAADRTSASQDRGTASSDRRAAATDRAVSSLDGLTGAYLRGPGLVELDREMARTRRSGEPLVLAFIDVDHLKAVNDTSGHAAGDRMLAAVARTLRARMRDYDLLIRHGGDEFLCVITGLSLIDATDRLGQVHEALTELAEPTSVTIGITELLPDEGAEALIARADAALYKRREA